MTAQISLVVTAGPLTGRTLVFTETDTCLIGRDPDCHLALPDDADHRRVSRHHCRLEITPPRVRLQDLNSRNGTLVNNQVVSVRSGQKTPVPGEIDLRHGDSIHLGATIVLVQVALAETPRTVEEAVNIPNVCDRCWCDVPPEQQTAWAVGDGSFLCPKCRVALAASGPRAGSPVCMRCGQPVLLAPLRPGEMLCSTCLGTPGNLLLGVQLPATLPQIEGYTIARELGKGGMGAVYQAREEATGRDVALKVMLPALAVNPRARDLFQREMRAIRLLDHPNIIKFLDTGCSGGVFYFTMEFCEGGSVRDLLKSHGPLPVPQALDLTRQALTGLEYAHTAALAEEAPRGVVHRDLSPDNLFLAGAGVNRVCKIGDYGLATAIDRSGLSGQTRTGAMGGKPAYVCRQQVRGYRLARPEVDVWALAACLYAMLTGSPPRDFPKGRDAWTIVLETPPVPIRQRRSGLPDGLADFLDRALDDSGELAFPTATAFRLALSGIIN